MDGISPVGEVGRAGDRLLTRENGSTLANRPFVGCGEIHRAATNHPSGDVRFGPLTLGSALERPGIRGDVDRVLSQRIEGDDLERSLVCGAEDDVGCHAVQMRP